MISVISNLLVILKLSLPLVSIRTMERHATKIRTPQPRVDLKCITCPTRGM